MQINEKCLQQDLQALQEGSESRESTSINVGFDYKQNPDAEDVVILLDCISLIFVQLIHIFPKFIKLK